MTNADLALGASHAVVLSPLGYSEGNPVSGHLRAEVAHLRAAGCRVSVIVPDPASLEALGDNVLDPARCGPSARAGLALGLALGPALARAWNGAPEFTTEGDMQ
jgi:NTE family protein